MELKENERIDDLEYKGLKIIQNKDGFCFGIDSVLLSDYAKNIKNDSVVMDIGKNKFKRNIWYRNSKRSSSNG